MKKRFLFLLALSALCANASLYADRFLPEIKVGSFRPFSDNLRTIYTEGWGNYQVELSYSPFNDCQHAFWGHFFVWGSYNYMFDRGSTREQIGDDETDIQLYNFSLGLKFLYPLPCYARLYLSAAPKYLFLRIDNKDESVDRRERARGLGSVYSLGLIFHPYKRLVVDFYSDVTLKKFSESNFTKENEEVESSIDVSGITFGIGCGITF